MKATNWNSKKIDLAKTRYNFTIQQTKTMAYRRQICLSARVKKIGGRRGGLACFREFPKARSKHNNTAAAEVIGDMFVLKSPDPLFQEFYPEGHYIIKQHTLGNKFYILSEGRVKVTKTNKGTDE